MKYKSTRVQEYKSALAPLIGIILGAIIAFALLILVGHAEAQNCPLDWHPPPCGKPPKPINDHKKEVAKAKIAELQKSIWYFSAATFVNCVGGRYLGSDSDKIMGGACLASGAGLLAANIMKEQQEKIVKDDPFDPEYGSPYQGRWLSYEDLGLDQIAPSDNPYVNNIAEHLQAVEFSTNYILVSYDRVMSCYQMGIDTGWWHDCQIWQAELVDLGFSWLGQRMDAIAYNLWYLTEELTSQGHDPELIWQLQNMAGWTYWAGGEYQQ